MPREAVEPPAETMAKTIPESQVFPSANQRHGKKNRDKTQGLKFPHYKPKKPHPDGPGAGHKLPTKINGIFQAD